MLSIKILLVGLLGAARGREVGIPERYLRPRDFNPHPFLGEEGEGEGGGGLGGLPEVHPYALFRRPPLRGEDDGAPIQFPKVPDAVPPPRPRPRLLAQVQGPTPRPFFALVDPSLTAHAPPPQEPILNAIQVQPPPPPPHVVNAIQVRPLKKQRYSIAKNYAFSYTVRDHQSGDDFSHSQAHSGEATKGEYRVKLPDGRTQVVSYTADHRGYRADVRYDNEVGEDYSKAHKKVPTYKQSSYKSPSLGYKQVLYKPYKGVYYPVDYPDYGLEYARPQKDYTPIHEDYADEEEEQEAVAPQSVAGYYPSPSPSPPPHYEEYHIVTTPAPAQAKLVVLPQHLAPIH